MKTCSAKLQARYPNRKRGDTCGQEATHKHNRRHLCWVHYKAATKKPITDKQLAQMHMWKEVG